MSARDWGVNHAHTFGHLNGLIALITCLAVAASALLFWKEHSYRTTERVASEYHLAAAGFANAALENIDELYDQFSDLPGGGAVPIFSQSDLEQRWTFGLDSMSNLLDSIQILQQRFDDARFRQTVDQVAAEFSIIGEVRIVADEGGDADYQTVPESLAAFRSTMILLRRQHTDAHKAVRLQMAQQHSQRVVLITVFFFAVLVIGIPLSVYLYRQTRSAVRAIQSVSLMDDLTKLNNRRGFMTLADQLVRSARRYRLEVSLVFFDLDDLKFVNDTWGHEAGNQTLTDTAQILRDTARDSDLVARVGGDEFVVMLAGSGEAERFVSRLEARLSDHNRGARQSNQLSVSAGIAHLDPKGPMSLEGLIVRADGAMYAHKRRRKSPDVGIRLVSVGEEPGRRG